jgi:hypothetical protein
VLAFAHASPQLSPGVKTGHARGARALRGDQQLIAPTVAMKSRGHREMLPQDIGLARFELGDEGIERAGNDRVE